MVVKLFSALERKGVPVLLTVVVFYVRTDTAYLFVSIMVNAVLFINVLEGSVFKEGLATALVFVEGFILATPEIRNATQIATQALRHAQEIMLVTLNDIALHELAQVIMTVAMGLPV